MTRNEAGHGANFCKEPDLEKERKNTVLKTIKKSVAGTMRCINTVQMITAHASYFYHIESHWSRIRELMNIQNESSIRRQ